MCMSQENDCIGESSDRSEYYFAKEDIRWCGGAVFHSGMS